MSIYNTSNDATIANSNVLQSFYCIVQMTKMTIWQKAVITPTLTTMTKVCYETL